MSPKPLGPRPAPTLAQARWDTLRRYSRARCTVVREGEWVEYRVVSDHLPRSVGPALLGWGPTRRDAWRDAARKAKEWF